MQRFLAALVAITGSFTFSVIANAAGDRAVGARVFRTCAACHSLEPGRHMTGPSLAHLWGRKAGTVGGFTRYSPALKSAGIVWNEKTLDVWLADPKALAPGNSMTFPGIKDTKARTDLIAFLKAISTNGSAVTTANGGGKSRGPQMQNLKILTPANQVTGIRHCRDTYHVTTATGELAPFWEFNLRFKTDSSDTGPAKGQPAIMGAGMMGDRASVIFADPTEISAFIKKGC